MLGNTRRGAAVGLLSTAALLAPAMGAETGASIPDLSGHWGRTNFNLEQPPSGPALIVNKMRKPDGTSDENAARVGDYANPLLTPEGAAILKKHGEFSLTGQSIPDPHNQCWPEPPPFTLTIQLGIELLQTKDEVLLLYQHDHHVRHVRMNVPHATPLKPSWEGDSIGHYEGDTLVVDTIGIKTGPLAVIDRYGTPFSDALHVVERYRLIDGKTAADAIRRHRRTLTLAEAPVRYDAYGTEIDLSPEEKGLQVEVTVDDPKIFARPWTGLVTYQRAIGDWPEMVCAENLREAAGPNKGVPVADKPDF